MDSLTKRLVLLNAEEDWVASDLNELSPDHVVFRRYALRLLTIFIEEFSGICGGCIALAGFSSGKLTPMAVLPATLAGSAHEIPRSDADAFHELTGAQAISIATEVALSPFPADITRSFGHQLVIKLIGHGEYIGLLWLHSMEPGYFFDHVEKAISEAEPILTRNVAEAIFSVRVQALGAPFVFRKIGQPTKQELYDQITDFATLGFASDGAVLRLYDANEDKLTVESLKGDARHEPGKEGSVAERICRAVFDSAEHYGTARTIGRENADRAFGVSITEIDEAELNRAGVGSYMVMRLQSDIGQVRANASENNELPTAHPALPAKLGTLSIFHHRPHAFSLRDIHLFRSYSERVADDIALLQHTQELEHLNLMLRMQFGMQARAEIVALLAHDLGHKAIHTTEAAKILKRTCVKALRDKRGPDAIDTDYGHLLTACEAMELELGKIRATTTRVDEKPIVFDVATAFVEVRNTLISALERNNMDMSVTSTGNTNCFGAKGLFQQAVFNLVINSIDAQKELKHPRKNTIQVLVREEIQGSQRRIMVQFWDEGPGINQRVFPDPKAIFEIGKTSKPEGKGSGTGLPISRSVLSNYYNAELDLLRREGAHFEIRIPGNLPHR